MPHCKTCGEYYRTNQFNKTEECEYCVDQIGTYTDFDDEDMLEVQSIMNPSGKIKARFLDE